MLRNPVLARLPEPKGLTTTPPWEAVYQAERGLIDADLGGGVIKQRFRLTKPGKSAGFGASCSSVAARRRSSSTVLLRATGTTSGGTN